MNSILFEIANNKAQSQASSASSQARTQAHIAFDTLLAQSQSRDDHLDRPDVRDELRDRRDVDRDPPKAKETSERKDEFEVEPESYAAEETDRSESRDHDSDIAASDRSDSTSRVTPDGDSDEAAESGGTSSDDMAPGDRTSQETQDGQEAASAAPAPPSSMPTATASNGHEKAQNGAANAAAAASKSPAPTAQAAEPAAGANDQSKTSAAGNGAKVTNAALVSQPTAALTDGSAVVTLQAATQAGQGTAQRVAAATDNAVQVSSDNAEATVDVKPAAAPVDPAAVRKTAGNGQLPNAAQTATAGLPAAGQAQSTARTGASATAPVEGPANLNGAPTQATQPASGTTFSSLAAVGGSGQVNGTSAAQAATAPGRSAPVPASEQVAVEIRKGVAAGKDAISIRLSPAELGRIDIKMELSDDGTLRAMIAAEKPETLDMLQKDAKTLERALQNAGLQTDSGNLNFSLRGQDRHSGGFETTSNASPSDGQSDDGSDGDLPAGQNQARQSSHDGAVDISV